MDPIITLQFGHFANFVGAHYWNIQVLSSYIHLHDLKDEVYSVYEDNSDIYLDAIYRYGKTQSVRSDQQPS